MKILFGFILLMIAFIGLLIPGAHAQVSCPPGMTAYGTGQDQSVCGPDNSNPQSPSGQSSSQGFSLPTERWESRWGAIATDAARGALGAAQNKPDGSVAEQSAIADCQSKGGRNCKIKVSFSNGCGAMILGDKAFTVNDGSTADIAIQKAMNKCNKVSANCHVYYTTCSLPVAHIQ